MWSIVSSMKLLRKPSKRGEGDIERNKGSSASLKDHSSKEANISHHLDSDVQVNLDPSCSTDTNVVTLNGKSATLGSLGASSSGESTSTLSSSGTSKVKVERRESARLASSATKFLRSLRNHSGGGKLGTTSSSSVLAADDKHPINVIALKELDIDQSHSLHPGAGGGPSGSSTRGTTASGKLPERSQSFNEKRLLVVTQNTSSDNGGGTSGAGGTSTSTGASAPAPVKVKHSRAQSFVCNNSSSRNKSGYSIYLNHHHQFQSSQQNQANLAKQQLLFDHQTKHQQSNNLSPTSGGGCSDVNRNLQHHQQKVEGSKSVESSSTPSSSSSAPSSRTQNLQSCETIYENLEVILEEKQNKEQQMKNKLGNSKSSTSQSNSNTTVPVQKGESQTSHQQNDNSNNSPSAGAEAIGSKNAKTGSSSESLNAAAANMKISGKDRSTPCQIIRNKYNKDSGYETSSHCSDYSNIPAQLPKSPSVDSILGSRMMMAGDKQGQQSGSSGSRNPGQGQETGRSSRLLNTSLYEEINVSSINDDRTKIHNTPSASGGSRKLRRSISEVPSERNTNLAKLQTKVGDSTARAMYTIANGLAIWTTEKSNSSLVLNSGGGGSHSGSTQGLHQYQNLYGCRQSSSTHQLLHPQSIPPIPGGFSAAIQQASVYSTLPRNHHASSSSIGSSTDFGIYRGFQQYRNIPPSPQQQQATLNSHQAAASAYHNYSQIAAKSTPSLRNAVLQEHQQKCSADEAASTSSTKPTESQQNQPIYQAIPVPTLSPARSTPNLGSTGGANKLLLQHPRPRGATEQQLQQQQQYHHIKQGSVPQLSTGVNTLGKVYPPKPPHQKLYNHFGGSSTCLASQPLQSLSSSVVQLQQLHNPNDKFGATPEPGRYPSTPNLQQQKSDSNSPTSQQQDDSASQTPQQCNPSESHTVEPGNNNTGSTNNFNTKSISTGAMSGNNDSSMTTTTPTSCIGGNWNSIADAHHHHNLINNNNNNNSAPVRDPSSLKHIRYGPGHEKYPSWPIPVSSAQQVDPVGESQPVKLVLSSGSTRSKSWTEQTDYPKEKTPSYTRPYMKRANHSYTQQLKTVMEKCERIPPEAYASQVDPQNMIPTGHQRRNSPHHHPHSQPHHQLPSGGGLPKNNEGNGGSIVPPPLLYRDLMANSQNGQMVGYNTHHHQQQQHHNNMHHYYQTPMNPQQQVSQQHMQHQNSGGGEKEYAVPNSPPERVIPEKESSGKPLTQEDLELYTKKYEELITQYPQSEGYHSYISSDSSSYISSGTPFLDQLRRESENNQQFWNGDSKALSIAALSGICDPNDPLFGLMGAQLGSAAVSGRESVTTVVTNSSSNSSGTETLKWHGSTSDISLSSGIGGGGSNMNNVLMGSALKHNPSNISRRKGGGGWNEEQQNIAHSARLSTPQKQHAATPDQTAMSCSPQQNGMPSNYRNQMEHLNGSSPKWHSNDTMESSGSNRNNSSNNNNSNSNNSGSNNSGSGGGNNPPPNLKKFPLNTYTRPNTLTVDKTNPKGSSGNSSSATSTPEKMAKLLQTFQNSAASESSSSSPPSNLKGAKSLSHSLSSPVIDTSKPPSVAERIMELEQQSQQSSASPSTSGTSSPKMGQGQSSDNLAFLASNFIKSSSLNNLQNSPAGLYIDGEHVNPSGQQTQQQNEWQSSPSQGNRATPVSPRGFMQSLSSTNVSKAAASGGDNPMTYSYLDPDKKHKVADMTLKAIQKKALLSYYERHKGKCTNTSSASSVSSSDGNSSQADMPPERDLCFSSSSGKSNRLMLSLPREHNSDSQNSNSNMLLSPGSSGTNPLNSTPSSSPSISGGHNRPYRAISVSSGVSSASSSSRSSSASNSKVSSHSQQQQHPITHGANNSSPKTSMSSATTGLPEDIMKQVDKSDSKLSGSSTSSSPEMENSELYNGADSARLAYMSKYLPHLVNRDSTSSSSASSSSAGWSSSSSAKLPPGGANGNNGATSPVTQEPAPIPPERPPKKPHLRNLAQQVHEEGKDSSKPPPPLPRAPVRPTTTLLNNNNANGAAKSGNMPPPIPSKPGSNNAALGMTRSPSPDELPPPPPPPPTEEMEVLVNDEPLPPPPTVSEVDVLFGSRTRSVTGLSSCLHKDSYMAQRKERTLGYEGRYRRTLSPSGLGSNNNNSKSSLTDTSSPSPSTASTDSMVGGGTTRSMTNLGVSGGGGSGKLDSTLSPTAWEKFHNIRPPSTTVIFTSNELSKVGYSGGSPTPSSTAGSSSSSSGSPQPPPLSQPLFHRSISCDSNIFNNKTGASQSSIPPPVAQVAPLRGPNNITTSSNNEKLSQSCDNENNSSNAPERDNVANGVINSDGNSEKEENRYFEKANGKQVGGEEKVGVNPLPSVIVPPLQYEKYEKDTRNGGIVSSHHHGLPEANKHSILKKSELSLRVNCTSVVTLQTDSLNGGGVGGGDAPPASSSSSAADATSKAANASNSTASFYTGRQKTQEELECEELSRDIAKMLPQGDKLQTLLVPLPDHKTTADYMEGLFHLELKLQPDVSTETRRGSQSQQGAAVANLEKAVADNKKSQNFSSSELSSSQRKQPSPHVEDVPTTTSQKQKTATDQQYNAQNNQPMMKNQDFSHSPNGSVHSENYVMASSDSAEAPVSPNAKSQENNEKKMQPNAANIAASYRRCNGHAPLPADSAYFTTSESKAKFLTQYNKDIKKDPIDSGTDSEELDKQKEELVSRISRKLEILRTEQLLLREEIQGNEQLGQMVVERVKQTAKRNEFDKFKLHVEEIEKITSLLLGISGRLARAENALMGLSDPPNPQEKKILESKRDKLREQLDEAKILKENIDRRSAQVSNFLQKYLTAEEYADYDHFVKMKAKLIIDAREIDDKIKLGEEQLGALKDALNTSLPLPSSIST